MVSIIAAFIFFMFFFQYFLLFEDVVVKKYSDNDNNCHSSSDELVFRWQLFQWHCETTSTHSSLILKNEHQTGKQYEEFFFLHNTYKQTRHECEIIIFTRSNLCCTHFRCVFFYSNFITMKATRIINIKYSFIFKCLM